jgi:flagellar basal-body rod protein FlgC
MDIATSISVSGMQAASLRLNAAAANIVNANSDGPVGGANAYQPVSVSQSSVPNGGTSASLQPVTPSSLLAYNPSSPYANVQGMVAQPNVDLPTEMVNMKEASNDFRASLAAYKVSSEMFKSLLDATA